MNMPESVNPEGEVSLGAPTRSQHLGGDLTGSYSWGAQLVDGNAILREEVTALRVEVELLKARLGPTDTSRVIVFDPAPEPRTARTLWERLDDD